MMEAVGHPVLELVRRQFGPLHLGSLAAGHSRDLTTVERGNLLTLAREGEQPEPATEGDRHDRRAASPARSASSGPVSSARPSGTASAAGVDVILDDASPANLRLAIDYGAGRAAGAGDDPKLVVVAVPPDATAEVVARELAAYPAALVTDVSSVKTCIRAELDEAGADVDRYVGSHPLAGRERGGAISARADIFEGRPWVICGGTTARPARSRTSRSSSARSPCT